MPELPEVATMVRAFRPRLVGRRVTHALVEEQGLLVDAGPADLAEALIGATVAAVERRGKYVRIDFAPTRGRGPRHRRGPGPGASLSVGRPPLLAPLLEGGSSEKAGRSRPASRAEARALVTPLRDRRETSPAGMTASLVIHLKMTGRFFVMGDNGHPLPSRTRLVLAVEGVEEDLLFGMKDVRRLGRAWLLVGEAAHEWPEWLELGPDALAGRLTGPRLAGLVSGRRAIKVALLDQSKLAGLGNIYASEVLHRSRIHPARPADSLSPAEWARLATDIPKLLRLSMRRWCTLSRWVGPAVEGYGDFRGELGVYGRAGQSCRRCGGMVESTSQAARTTYYCGECQK